MAGPPAPPALRPGGLAVDAGPAQRAAAALGFVEDLALRLGRQRAAGIFRLADEQSPLREAVAPSLDGDLRL